MDFSVACSCGKSTTVSEGAAGSRFDCSCGQSIAVPSLTDLRVQAGLPPQAPNPTAAIPFMVADGELPTMTACARCAGATDDTVTVTVECEIASGNEPSGIAAVFLFLVFGFWVLLLRTRKVDRPQLGDSRIVHCPLRMCQVCQRQMARNAGRWRWMAAIQVVIGLVILVWSDWGALLFLGAAITFVWEMVARQRQRTALKSLLAREPIYEQLLDDFPHANVLLNVD